ncbi:MAG: nucleoside triphosphate pyrophosphohydrolase family protein [Methylobacter sp.]|uniref:nucleoside triphosphate pyrophosphohydrolase family protein n=1 Tax=Methylobacter sp. TaxID=2051955 RepID=UPI00273018B9|nr:nucleoside triphosphate pyrophosphohydrolase family protein [Methylobacter sp.]MDP1663779.1 nucleoside triphosphate pyrophosphohydrolase family protein [Methylobacter sp.]
MNKHLKLVREFHDTFSLPQAEHGANERLSDMDIVMRQALLMDEGSAVLKAIKAGDMVEILAGLVNLAYCALGAIAIRGSDVTDRPVTWRHDGFILSIIRILSDRINNCTSGNTDDYSAVYCLCAHLSSSFINADFNKAFQMIHDGKIAKEVKEPDLSACLFE